jgi:HK97 family phage portal protein
MSNNPITLRKAAVAAVTSLFGVGETPRARPLPGALGMGGYGGWIREPYAGAWQRGDVEAEPVGALTAFGAVYACITRIANDIAKLDVQLLTQALDGFWDPVTVTSPFMAPINKPNNFQNRIQFFVYWLCCKLIHGNTYVLKIRDGRGMVKSWFILDPRRVLPLVTPVGDVYYALGVDDLSQLPNAITVPASEIIHDRMNCLWHPLVGISPLYACAFSATQGLRTQKNSIAFFANMSRPSGMLTAPAEIDDVTAARLKTEFESNYGGANVGRLFVAGDGLKYEGITIPAEQAQLIEQLDWSVKDVARAFGMPLYKIGAGDPPGGDSADALNQQYYDDCLQPHIEQLELCVNEGLATPTRTMIQCDLRGLLRMDQLAQIEKLAKAVQGTIMKPNEARRELNLRPVAGGNSIYLQQQNYSLEALAKRDAKADPFAAAPAPTPAPSPAPTPAPTPAPAPAEGKAFDGDELVKHLELFLSSEYDHVL